MTRTIPSHHRQFEQQGARLGTQAGQAGAQFTVWAPHARSVAVVGDFNGWQGHALQPQGDGSGRWAGFVPGASLGQRYKYRIETADGRWLDKADPFALCAEHPPLTASRLWDLAYDWQDADWMAQRGARQALDQPMAIYEVHLGSWQRGEGGEFLNYRDLARRLALTHYPALITATGISQ